MEIIGWIGTALVIIAYYPQIRHLYVEKCAWGISISTWVIWLVASFFLLAYAVFGHRTLFIVVQAINLIAIALTVAKPGSTLVAGSSPAPDASPKAEVIDAIH